MPFLLPLNKPNSHSLPPRILFSNPLIQWCTLVLSSKLLKIACCQMAVPGDSEQTPPTWEASVSPPWTTSVESEESLDYSLAPSPRVGGGTVCTGVFGLSQSIYSVMSHTGLRTDTPRVTKQTGSCSRVVCQFGCEWLSMCVSLCVYMCLCICVYMFVSLCVVCVYVYLCVSGCGVSACMCVRLFMSVCMCVHMCTHAWEEMEWLFILSVNSFQAAPAAVAINLCCIITKRIILEYDPRHPQVLALQSNPSLDLPLSPGYEAVGGKQHLITCLLHPRLQMLGEHLVLLCCCCCHSWGPSFYRFSTLLLSPWLIH